LAPTTLPGAGRLILAIDGRFENIDAGRVAAAARVDFLMNSRRVAPPSWDVFHILIHK
jgi:hypothetical protein